MLFIKKGMLYVTIDSQAIIAFYEPQTLRLCVLPLDRFALGMILFIDKTIYL